MDGCESSDRGSRAGARSFAAGSRAATSTAADPSWICGHHCSCWGAPRAHGRTHGARSPGAGSERIRPATIGRPVAVHSRDTSSEVVRRSEALDVTASRRRREVGCALGSRVHTGRWSRVMQRLGSRRLVEDKGLSIVSPSWNRRVSEEGIAASGRPKSHGHAVTAGDAGGRERPDRRNLHVRLGSSMHRSLSGDCNASAPVGPTEHCGGVLASPACVGIHHGLDS